MILSYILIFSKNIYFQFPMKLKTIHMFRGIFSMSNTPTRHLIYYGSISLLHTAYILIGQDVFLGRYL